ncbi:MAG: alpha/beta fold hydrolase [Thermoguttaceae bacterium]|jgi:3-oxoadipate enol-lactonase
MKTCTINGTNLSFVDRGGGRPILFVHGFPLDHSMWNGQIERLSDRYRVIAPDLRGFGRSGTGEGIVTMAQFADDLAALLDFLGIDEPAALCGLSMGGYIALEFWRWYAERLQGLILCDTRTANDAPETAAGRLAVAEKVLREGSHIVADTMIPRLFSADTLQNQPHLVENIRQIIISTDPRGIAAAARGMARRADFTAELPRIRCPTLLIVGESDVITPAADMQEIAKSVPNAEFKIIPQAGHMAPLEQPEAVNAAIAGFLRRI